MVHRGTSSVPTKRMFHFSHINQNLRVTKTILKEIINVNLILKEKNYVKEPSIVLKMKYIPIMVLTKVKKD